MNRPRGLGTMPRMATRVSNEQALSVIEDVAEMQDLHRQQAAITARCRALGAKLSERLANKERRAAFMAWADLHAVAEDHDKRLVAQGLRNLLIMAYDQDRASGL